MLLTAGLYPGAVAGQGRPCSSFHYNTMCTLLLSQMLKGSGSECKHISFHASCCKCLIAFTEPDQDGPSQPATQSTSHTTTCPSVLAQLSDFHHHIHNHIKLFMWLTLTHYATFWLRLMLLQLSESWCGGQICLCDYALLQAAKPLQAARPRIAFKAQLLLLQQQPVLRKLAITAAAKAGEEIRH